MDPSHVAPGFSPASSDSVSGIAILPDGALRGTRKAKSTTSGSAVRAAWPATRPAHAFLKFGAYPLDVLLSSFRSLHGNNPADPLIARQRRNVFPFCPRRRIGNENVSQIRRHSVYRAGRDRFLGHGFILSVSPLAPPPGCRGVHHASRRQRRAALGLTRSGRFASVRWD